MNKEMDIKDMVPVKTSERHVILDALRGFPSCEYRIDCKLEFRKNKAEKRMPIIKLYTGLALRRLKRFSNIKSFQAFSFTFTALNGIWCNWEQRDFWKSTVGIDKSPVFGERNLISNGLCLD